MTMAEEVVRDLVADELLLKAFKVVVSAVSKQFRSMVLVADS